MKSQRDFLFRPVLRGMFHAERLIDASIDLAFILECNAAIDCEEENQARQRAAEQT